MSRVKIIAEIGVNHNGNLDLAKALVDKAKIAGADVVKFQTFKADRIASSIAEMADYQKRNTGYSMNQRRMLEKLELSSDDLVEIIEHCNARRIEFLSSPFDIDSINLLSNMGCHRLKVPSGEITNYPYLVQIAKTALPVILSTGMSTMSEVEQAVNVLKDNGSGEITLLHCTTQYPASFKDLNLRAIQSLKNKFDFKVGYSDHSLGIEASIAAVALGAEVIEKHFTLNRELEGPDHIASLEPNEFNTLVNCVRNIELSLGSGEKRPAEAEMENIKIARKSIVADRKIQKGEYLSDDNITTKRPGTGINPMRWNEVIGTRAIRDFEEDELIEI